MDNTTAERLKAKLNGLLTERQKNEILTAIKGMDKNQLLKIMSQSGVDRMSEDQLISIINKTDTDKLSEILKNF